jgi:HSP20 family molecular chaperone IbpA
MSGLKEFGESAAREVLEKIGRGVSKVQERKPLAYDLLESDDAYLVVFDAPGATRSDVQVRFVESEVQVRIDRFRDFYEHFDMRFPGRGLSLDGTAELPDDAAVDAESAGATLKSNGTLHVTIPKTGAGKDVAVADDEGIETTDDHDAEEHADGAEEHDEEADHDEEHAEETEHDEEHAADTDHDDADDHHHHDDADEHRD